MMSSMSAMGVASETMCSSGATGSFSVIAGDVYWCAAHNQYNCPCYWNVGSSDNTYVPPISTPCVPNPWVITTTFTLPECALCDKALEIDDKKVCKDCKGVLDAWRFLSKKDVKEEE